MTRRAWRLVWAVALAVMPIHSAQAGVEPAAPPAAAPAAAAAATVDPGDSLRRAAAAGDLAAVRAALAAGVAVDAANQYGATALAYACDHGRLEVVEALLTAGADPNTSDTFYKATPLVWAAQRGHASIVRMLLAKGAGGVDEALTSAVYGESLAVIQALVEAGKPSADALTNALAVAEAEKLDEIAETLRAGGAKPPPPADFVVDPAVLASYVGDYAAAPDPARPGPSFSLQIRLVDGKLTGQGGGPPFELGALDATSFRPLAFPGAKLVFTSEGGKATKLTFHQGGEATDLLRQEAKP